MNARYLASACLIGITLLGCQRSARIDVGATQLVLDSLLVVHARHIIREELDSLLDHYTDDAVVRSNHAVPLRGRTAIRSFIEVMFAQAEFHTLTYSTEALAVYGDSAWHILNYGLTGTMGGQPIADTGSAYALWSRDSQGTWRIKDDVLNSHLPLPQAPTTGR